MQKSPQIQIENPEEILRKLYLSGELKKELGALSGLVLLNPENSMHYEFIINYHSNNGNFRIAYELFRRVKFILDPQFVYSFKRMVTYHKQFMDSRPSGNDRTDSDDYQKKVQAGRLTMNILSFMNGRRKYASYPRAIHLETQAVCNAACVFCPYESMERKGVKMPMETIKKIIDDLSQSPMPFTIMPYKVSDPFLDKRIFEICEYIEENCKKAHISFITNGHALTGRTIDRLWELRRVGNLTISVNESDPELYGSVMKVSQKPLVRALDRLKDKVRVSPAPFPIRFTRVSDGTENDQVFVDWCETHYGDVGKAFVVARNDWIGQTESVGRTAPDIPCGRWFDLSITATGKVAMCCMDGQCEWPIGDVNETPVLDIYNSEHYRRFRTTFFSRLKTDSPCATCTYL